jgi:hypothetical protein
MLQSYSMHPTESHYLNKLWIDAYYAYAWVIIQIAVAIEIMGGMIVTHQKKTPPHQKSAITASNLLKK